MPKTNETHENGTERYKLTTSLAITKETWFANGPDQGYWQANYNNERLTVNEESALGSMDFLGVMKVLGQLHDAIQAIPKAEAHVTTHCSVKDCTLCDG